MARHTLPAWIFVRAAGRVIVRLSGAAGWDDQTNRTGSAVVLGQVGGVEPLRGQRALELASRITALSGDGVDGADEGAGMVGHTD